MPWPYALFIDNWTSVRRGTAAFMLALWCQYHTLIWFICSCLVGWNVSCLVLFSLINWCFVFAYCVMICCCFDLKVCVLHVLARPSLSLSQRVQACAERCNVEECKAEMQWQISCWYNCTFLLLRYNVVMYDFYSWWWVVYVEVIFIYVFCCL